MIVFFTEEVIENQAVLPVDESRHCILVLRKKKGDRIRFTDGKGSWYEGEIIKEDKKKCILTIIDKETVPEESPKISLAVALTKNSQRFDWFVEKATELGVNEFFPLICAQSERQRFNLERSQRIAVAAMKQSLKAYLPFIHEAIHFSDFLPKVQAESKYIAHLKEDATHLFQAYDGKSSVCCLVGPEGDFTKLELQTAFERGFEIISLGKSRLRTETAGIVAMSFMKMKQEIINS